jgi:hypothetical protein
MLQSLILLDDIVRMESTLTAFLLNLIFMAHRVVEAMFTFRGVGTHESLSSSSNAFLSSMILSIGVEMRLVYI